MTYFASTSYDSLTPGKRLLVTGGVHGDEYCGPEAVKRVITAVESGDVVVQKGALECIPVCNPKAYAQRTRFVERNLNRYLFPKEDKTHYEDFIDPALCAAIDRADFLVDLHSYASQGDAFMFIGNKNAEETAFARALGIRDFVCGWAEAYGDSGKKGDKESQGTTEYVRLQGGLGVTLECGHHHNKDAADVGYYAALRALDHLGMLAPDCAAKQSLPAAPPDGRCVRMKSVFYRDPGMKWVKEWRHFDELRKGDVIATSDAGATVLAQEDGFIVLPKAHAKVGEEWFYFGVRTDFCS